MIPSGIVTLTTDFGMEDPYVGIMKGVILSVYPLAKVVDITHQVRPGAIAQGAWILREAYGFFPHGTVHVAVVDPGVGGSRRPIVVATEGHLFVGPDNGLLWPVMASSPGVHIIHLAQSRYFLSKVSPTFHGRDIFAPVAGHLAHGVNPRDLGPQVKDPAKLAMPVPEQRGGVLVGEVLWVDHFGNLITNIRRGELEEFLEGDQALIRIKDRIVHGISKTYSDGRQGELMALVGSYDLLEIALNLGMASEDLGAGPWEIRIERVPTERQG